MSGDAQVGTVGQPLPAALVVRVVDAEGRPVRGQVVNFRITSGGGSVFGGSGASNADGVVQERWTLGTVTSDSQRVEARAVDAATGAPVVYAVFRATPTAGPAAVLGVATDTALVLGTADTSRIRLAGTDGYGNVIPPGALSATWATSAAAVASVDAAGLVQGVGAGEATITATAGTATARVRVTVNGTRLTLYEVATPLAVVAEGGGRLLARSDAGVLRWSGSAWVLEADLNVAVAPSTVSHLAAFPSGEAWALASEPCNGFACPTLWHSAVPGAPWTRELSAPNGRTYDGMVLAGSAPGTPLLRTDTIGPPPPPRQSGYLNYPVVRRHDAAGGWTDLGFPPLVHDSAHQASQLAARAPDEVYLGGVLEPSQYAGTGKASLGYWDGSTWSFPDLVPGISGGHDIVSALVAAPGGGPVYGVVSVCQPCGSTRVGRLFFVVRGTVTFIANPLTARGAEITAVAVGADGRVALSHPGGVVWQEGAEWREHVLAAGWTAGALWWAADGTIWVSLSRRNAPGDYTHYIGALR